MPGLTTVAERILDIAKAATVAADALKDAVEQRRTYNEVAAAGPSVSSGKGLAEGGAESTKGASAGGAVDTNALGTALQITQGRLK